MPGVAYDPVDDGLSADGQQALGQVVGVGAHPSGGSAKQAPPLHARWGVFPKGTPWWGGKRRKKLILTFCDKMKMYI